MKCIVNVCNSVNCCDLLFPLAAAMIRGNHDNCCEFATKRWLRVFLKQLSMPGITHQVLMVIQCLLSDSPEVLNLLSEEDIGVIVNLLNTNGRDSEVYTCVHCVVTVVQ